MTSCSKDYGDVPLYHFGHLKPHPSVRIAATALALRSFSQRLGQGRWMRRSLVCHALDAGQIVMSWGTSR